MELQARLSERSEKGWSWICLIQEPYVVRGNVCEVGSASSTRHIESKSADPKHFPRVIINQDPKALGLRLGLRQAAKGPPSLGISPFFSQTTFDQISWTFLFFDLGIGAMEPFVPKPNQ